MAPPITPIGTTIKWNAAAVVGAKSIKVNYGSVDKISATDLSGAAETIFPTHRRRGSVSFDFNFDPDDTVHQALIADFLAKTSRATVVTLVDATPTTLTSSASYIEKLDVPSVDEGGPLTGSCTIQLTDDWVRA